jgi:hypothetical protein
VSLTRGLASALGSMTVPSPVMADPTATPDPIPAEPAAPPPKKRRRWPVVVAAIILFPILFFGLYVAVALTWSYSDGDRSGSLYKFSRKGWLCKTWEGELNITPTAAAPTIWRFTVRDDDVAKLVNSALGTNVVVHYSEHRGVPTTCFGETNFYVDAIKPVQR